MDIKKAKNDLEKNTIKTYQINISGIVQGVGFRPFIYNLARRNNLKGIVLNTTEGVLIKVNAEKESEINRFVVDIRNSKPAPAKIEKIEIKEIPYLEFTNFEILKSKETREKFQLISPDIATCEKCLEDINNINNRRYCYPFTNCTNCGPRFTIIKKMPYDRSNTTMRKFDLCPECLEEYNNPLDRRFHAQPNACKICGPKLLLVNRNEKIIDKKNPIISAADKIKNGYIIGIKSLGGFQIACDATSDSTVLKLRNRKKRPFKPFAIMIKNVDKIKENFILSDNEIKSLTSSKAPIVLIRKNIKNYPLSKYVSFYYKWEGIMLPYTPVHHLLFNHLDIPLVMTSGNISEEPIAAENNEALDKLKNICDYFLIHNRDIYSRYDDSVIKIFMGKEMIMRRARGYAPYPIKLDMDIYEKTILAVGAQEKNTFCIYKKNYAIVSQHLGDLDNMDSFLFFKSTLGNYRNLFNIDSIDTVVYDKHPNYTSTKFAKSLDDIPNKIEIQHHKAHIASVIAENRIKENILGISWDGTGYGDDGKIWGSEFFVVDKNMNFTRVAHLKEKLLPGGEITIKKPYRMALSYLYNCWRNHINNDIKNSKQSSNFSDFIYNNFSFYKKIISFIELETVKKQIETEFNSVFTTSMGRFFDTVSSLLNLTHINTYEGEAALHLEMISDENIKEEYDIKLEETDEKYIIDDFYITNQILADIENNIPADIISAKFHNTLIKIILEICIKMRKIYNTGSIALSGGVFQNNLLLTKCYSILKENDFNVYSNFSVPVNDGGISLGQSYLAAHKILASKERRTKLCV